jgi:hypothetical protein
VEAWNRFKQSIVAAALGFDDRVRKARAGRQALPTGVRSTRSRALVALLMAAVIVAAGYGAWSAWHSSRLAELASVPKSWPNDQVLPDNGSVEITTTCVDSVLSYVVVLVPPRIADAPSTLRDKTDSARLITDRLRQRLKTIHLTLVDKGGAPVENYDVAIEEFVRLYSNNAERPVVLEARGTRPCRVARYVRAETLRPGWTERRQ